MIVLTELHSLMKTVKINIASLVKDISISVPFKSDFDHHYSLPHFNTDVALKEVRRIVRSLIVVRDFPLEALTTSISDAEFPLRVTNVLIKKAKLKFLYQLVLEDRNLPYNWKGL